MWGALRSDSIASAEPREAELGRSTVLEKYQRLEAEGIWRPGPDSQRRDVIVSIGEATLTISDLNESVLTHWSLPALERANPGTGPAVYSPGADATDTLEIADAQMIDALEQVSRAIRRGQARPGRLRGGLLLLVGVLLAAVVVLWLPGAVSRYTASILPDAARVSIGRAVLADIPRVSGTPCVGTAGARALVVLKTRLFPKKERRLVVLPSALAGTAHLPGGILLVGHELVEDHETPVPLAEALVAEDLEAALTDPVETLLREAGVFASLRLLTTGHLSDADISRHTERLMLPSDPKVAPSVIRAALTAKGIGGADDPPFLNDSDWLALQQICER